MKTVMENKDQSAFGYGFANELSYQEVTGLSKREYFAGLAKQGLMSNPDYASIDIAREAIAIADQLLEQLSK